MTAPKEVLQGLVADGHFGGEGLLGEILHGAADGEVLVHLVVEVEAEHRLALHAVGVVALHRSVDGGAGVENALIDDGHTAHVVVHRVVLVLHEGDAAGGHHHGAGGNIGDAEINLSGSRSGVASHEHELVLLGQLLGCYACGVVERPVGVEPDGVLADAFLTHEGLQLVGEGLLHREVDAAFLHGVALNVVEASVGLVFVVLVQAVETEGAQQRCGLGLGVGEIGDVGAAVGAQIFDVELEFVPGHAAGAQRIDVFHHQAPHGRGGRSGTAFEELHDERCGVLLLVAAELTHLVGRAVERVLVGYGKDFVGLQRGVERDGAQSGVDAVLGGREKTGRLQLLEVGAALVSGGFKSRGGRGDVAHAAECTHRGVNIAGGVVGIGAQLLAGTVLVGVLRQSGHGHDVARVGGGAGLVGHPHFDALDGDAAADGGQRLHPRPVLLAHVVREVEVAVELVVGGGNLKIGGGSAALGRNVFRGGFLLRDDGLQFQLAELEVGAQAEERGQAGNQGVVGREADIAALDELDDFVFLALVFEFEILGVVVEGGVGVVVQVHLHLVAHLAGHREVDFLVEVEAGRVSAVDGDGGIVHVLHVDAQLEFGRSLRLDLHAAGAENLLRRADVELHVGEVKLGLARRGVGFRIALAVVGHHGAAQTPAAILVGRHQRGGRQVAGGRADRRADGGKGDADGAAYGGVVGGFDAALFVVTLPFGAGVAGTQTCADLKGVGLLVIDNLANQRFRLGQRSAVHLEVAAGTAVRDGVAPLGREAQREQQGKRDYNICACVHWEKNAARSPFIVLYSIFNANLMTRSTGASGSSERIFCTVLRTGAGEKPSIVRAEDASSITVSFSVLTADAAVFSPPDAPRARGAILSCSSTMMRWAAFGPMPFTLLSILSLPERMMSPNSCGERAERIMRAVAAPMPLTVCSRRNSERSSRVANPHS